VNEPKKNLEKGATLSNAVVRRGEKKGALNYRSELLRIREKAGTKGSTIRNNEFCPHRNKRGGSVSKLLNEDMMAFFRVTLLR